MVPCHSPEFCDTLRRTYAKVLAKSSHLLLADRLVAYDPHDEEEVAKSVGNFTVRLDARRGGKPKAAPAPRVMVCTPVDPSKFNFTKIRNAEERLSSIELAGSHYDFLTNKFPLCTGHMLLVARELVPQQLTFTHLNAVHELLQGCSFFVYFNSWGAAASVNHLHMHVIDERPPLMNFRLTTACSKDGIVCQHMDGYPGVHYVLSMDDLEAIWNVVRAMQLENQPHNLFFTADHAYIFPRVLRTPEKSLSLYGEQPGGLEFAGIFTVYSQDCYDALSEDRIREVLSLNAEPWAEISVASLTRGDSFTSTTVASDDSGLLSDEAD